MIDWVSVRDGLRDWTAAVTGLEAVWANEERPFMAAGVFAVLQVGQTTQLIGTETRYEEETPGSDVLIPVTLGTQQITVSIGVESQDQSAGQDASEYLERLRLRMASPPALGVFQSLGLAVVRVGTTVPADYDVDDRMVSRRSFDVTFAIGVEYRPEEEREGAITSVELTSHLTDLTGEQLSSNHQLTEETVP